MRHDASYVFSIFWKYGQPDGKGQFCAKRTGFLNIRKTREISCETAIVIVKGRESKTLESSTFIVT